MALIDYLHAEQVEEFNTHRSQRSGPELFAADLAGKNLTGVDLANANVEKADLSDSDLTEANLMRAKLAGIDGSNLKLAYAMGLKVKLPDAWLEGADLTGADFTRGLFNEACLKGTRGHLLRLLQASLKDVEAQNAVWQEADLSESTLTRADFTDADLSRSDFTESKANGATFERAQLDNVLATGGRFAGAIFRGASLNGARLSRANLSEADLSGADLTGADLSHANLTGAILTGAKLAGACLADAGLDNVDLTEVDLTGVDLSGLDPQLLGLSEAQIAGLTAWGAGSAADCPIRITKARSARNGAAVATVWLNADEAEEDGPKTYRWGVVRGKKHVTGTFSLDVDSVLSHHVVARNDGFEVVILRERPSGVVVLRFPLSMEGLGKPQSCGLGYGPLVVPVVTGGAAPSIWGVARRGPTVVRSEETTTEEGECRVSPVWSGRQPTVQGFFSRHHPILKCKGDVLIPLDRTGMGKPMRTPSGFGGRHAQAVPLGEDVLTLWVQTGKKGGIRYAVLLPRVAPEVEALSSNPAITSLDATTHEGEVLVAWTASNPKSLLETQLFVARLPSGQVTEVEAPVEPDEVRFVPGHSEGTGDAVPCLQLSTLDQGIVFCDTKGKMLGEIRAD